MTTYKNPWYRDGKGSGPEFYTTEAKAIEHRGHQLYNRIPGTCCDVVKDGVCVAQRVTVRNAMGWLDAEAARTENEAARAARTRVLLIGCGKTKASTDNGHLPARDLYTGNLFKARRAYAEASGHPWYILSAEWGLVQPQTLLAKYDTTISQLTPMQKRAWAMEAAEDLAKWTGKPLAELVLELHAGAEYKKALRSPWKPGEPPEVETPLEGLGIGEQLHWYKEAAIPTFPTPAEVTYTSPPCAHHVIQPAHLVPYFNERDLGGVLGADGNVYSDADPGL